ncbi:MAG: hypothetical protein K6B72_02035 [Lachnospiraceae bacterium]|nr:hypothetical protein [Lachnospiraceae bacterium]
MESTENAASGSQGNELPLVLVVSDSTGKMKSLKEAFSGRYKGVFVRDEASAEKYLKKHNVAFVIRDGQ